MCDVRRCRTCAPTFRRPRVRPGRWGPSGSSRPHLESSPSVPRSRHLGNSPTTPPSRPPRVLPLSPAICHLTWTLSTLSRGLPSMWVEPVRKWIDKESYFFVNEFLNIFKVNHSSENARNYSMDNINSQTTITLNWVKTETNSSYSYMLANLII